MKRFWKLDLLLYSLILLFLTFAFTDVFGQSPEMTRPGGCGADHLHHAKMQDPDFALQLDRMEEQVREYVEQRRLNGAARASTACVGMSATYRIPIVVHLCHYTTTPLGSGANLTDADVINSINLLNDRYSHTSGLTFNNPFSGLDVNIELVLARRDPSGNPTNGIIRHSDNTNAENVYGTDNTQIAFGWPSTDYFNLFIVETICDAGNCPTGNGVGGFAYFPSAHGQNYDGAVFRANSWWSGLVAHEAGHYFGLYHTFQGACVNNDCTTDGDRVCDTPPKTAPGFGGGTCAAPPNGCNADDDDLSANNPFRPVANGGLGDQTDDLENYMDYTASCWEAHTAGQRDRMHGFILGGRSSLLTSPALVPFSANDAGVTAINYPVDNICSSPFTPEVTLSNTGTTNLTSCNIRVELNGSLVQTFPFTGNIAPGGTQTVTLNPVTTGTGTHLLFIYSEMPNGAADGYAENDATCIEFDYNPPYNTYPMFEGFEAATFPPANFALYNPDGDYTFVRTTLAGGFGTSTASMLFDNFNQNEIGTVDELRTQVLDFSGQSSILLTFDVAYARYSGGNFDGLEVYYSTDCGNTWTQIFTKTGTTLATAPDQTTFFTPTNAQWRTETVSLSAAGLNNAPSVMLAFRNIPGWGNALYLDNINLNTSSLNSVDLSLSGSLLENEVALEWTYESDIPAERFAVEKWDGTGFQTLAEVIPGVQRGQAMDYTDPFPANGKNVYRITAIDQLGEAHASNRVEISLADLAVQVYPNPFEDLLHIAGLPAEGASMDVLDITGKMVFASQKIVSEAGGPATLDLQGLPTGMYFVRITTATGTSTHKLLKR